MFERAAAEGIAAFRVAQASYRDSGLSSAIMRGAIYRAADTLGALAGVAAAALAEEPRALAMVYTRGSTPPATVRLHLRCVAVPARAR